MRGLDDSNSRATGGLDRRAYLPLANLDATCPKTTSHPLGGPM